MSDGRKILAWTSVFIVAGFVVTVPIVVVEILLENTWFAHPSRATLEMLVATWIANRVVR